MSKYQHLFFDLDHTLWDFESNSKNVINTLYETYELQNQGIPECNVFFKEFSIQNDKLWLKYRNGGLKQDELRWKRFWNTLIHFKVANEHLAQQLSQHYIQLLPEQSGLLPYALDILDYCTDKGYQLHIITNGFEEVQHKKMANAQIHTYFKEIITSEKSMSLKPKKEIFDFALQASGALLSQSLMIGDNWEADIEGAQNAGMEQVFYNPMKTAINPDSKKATYEIACLSELKAIL